MIKLVVVLVIAVLIFLLVYFASDGDKTKAAILSALAAAIGFVGPYLVDLAPENAETVQENKIWEDKTTDSDEQGAPDSEKDSSQSMQTEPPTFSEESTSAPIPTPTSDSELSIDKIATVSMKVQSIESSAIQNTDAQIDAYEGFLSIEAQVDTYSFTPSVTGRYRFEISGLTEGTGNKVNLTIKNSGGGIINYTSYGVANGGGLTVKDMQAGETYQVQVEQYEGLDSYILSIGNQKETRDVTGYTIVEDSIEFTDQRNVYLFTPPITGRYRFEISDLAKGTDHKVNLLVFNAGGGEEASTTYGIANGYGLTIESMQAGQTYEVQVCQYSGYDSYSLNIGYQKNAVDISGYNFVDDSIQYFEQKNVYFFTPTITGRYRFEISNLTKGSNNKVNLYVWNSRDGEEGSTSYGIMNGGGLTIKDMQAGETYQIQVRQYSGYDRYTLNVGLQKETVDISGYDSVSDSIQYTDQRNVYTFTPSSSGRYRFEIDGLTDGSNNKVDVLVFNSRGGKEGETSYGITNGRGIEIDDLQAGEAYEVQVRYYSGYDSYKLITTRVVEQ